MPDQEDRRTSSSREVRGTGRATTRQGANACRSQQRIETMRLTGGYAATFDQRTTARSSSTSGGPLVLVLSPSSAACWPPGKLAAHDEFCLVSFRARRLPPGHEPTAAFAVLVPLPLIGLRDAAPEKESERCVRLVVFTGRARRDCFRRGFAAAQVVRTSSAAN